MVDVSGKQVTARTAVAERSSVLVSSEVVALLRGAGVPKGDTLACGAPRRDHGAPNSTPVVDPAVPPPVDLRRHRGPRRSPTTASTIVATVRTADRTGVEMEALTAVAVAGLTVIDMVKAVDKAAVITDDAGRGPRPAARVRGPTAR